jgi:hypothetical protein
VHKNFYKFREYSIDQISKRTVNRISYRLGSFDPVFDAVSFLEEEPDAEDATLDSTVVADFWGNEQLAYEFKTHVRWSQRQAYKKKQAAKGKTVKKREPQCSASLGTNRVRCCNPAKWVCASLTKAGNRAYQRRCEPCYEKVKDPAGYKRLQVGIGSARNKFK